MDRQYKAFISYRHLPLQMSVATRLHKFIEHYTIPKDLRKNGEKHPGLVFRDQDELPLSGNLSESIQTALDNSEFLIVVCTPETEQSKWVLREISYFIETHGRDHVLAVLADGNEATAFPKLLTEDYGENGDLLNHVEPLAANIAAPSEAARNRLLKTEGLRLIAALIGCNYDDLFRREQRYKRRRTAFISAAAIIAAGIYASTVTVKNAQIRKQNSQIMEQNVQIIEQNVQIEEKNEQIGEQLRQTQLNESRSLTQISKTAEKDGDIYSAVKNAYDALPTSEPDRPYYIPAEEQLAKALGLYSTEQFVYVQSIEQDTDIYATGFSPDGKKLMTLDALGTVRMFDAEKGCLIWQTELEGYGNKSILYGLGFSSDSSQFMIYYTPQIMESSVKTVYSTDDGAVLRSESGVKLVTGFQNRDLSDTYLEIAEDAYILRDFTDDHEIKRIAYDAKASKSVKAWALSESGRYLAVLEGTYSSDEKKDFYNLLILDMETDVLETVPSDVPYDVEGEYGVSFCGDIAGIAYSGYAAEDAEYESAVYVFSRGDDGWREHGRTYFFSGGLHSRKGSLLAGGELQYFGPTDRDSFFYCAKSYVCTVDALTGQITAGKALGSDVMHAETLNKKGFLALMTYDGMLTFYMASGTLTSEANIYFAETEQKVYGASLAGSGAKDAVYGFIFRHSKHRISIMRYANESDHEALYEFEKASENFHRYFLSPDQSLMVGLNYDSGRKVLYGICIETENPENSRKFEVEIRNFYMTYLEESDVYVTSDRMLYLNGYIIDMDRQTVSNLIGDNVYNNKLSNWSKAAQSTGGDKFTAACVLEKERKITLLRGLGGLTEDVPLPESAGEDLRVEAVAPDGSAVVSSFTESEGLKQLWIRNDARNVWTELDTEGILCADKADSEYFALSESGDTAAILTESDEIRLISSADGKTVRTIPYLRSTASVTRMVFAENDSVLVVYDYYGILSIYGTADGKLLASEDFSENTLNHQAGARVDILKSADGKKLIVIYDSSYYAEASFVVFDIGTWERSGHYIGAKAYLQKENTVILTPDNSARLSKVPLYSSEEIIDIAKDYLEAHG